MYKNFKVICFSLFILIIFIPVFLLCEKHHPYFPSFVELSENSFEYPDPSQENTNNVTVAAGIPIGMLMAITYA